MLCCGICIALTCQGHCNFASLLLNRNADPLLLSSPGNTSVVLWDLQRVFLTSIVLWDLQRGFLTSVVLWELQCPDLTGPPYRGPAKTGCQSNRSDGGHGATSDIITDITKFKKFNDSFQAETHCVKLADGTRCNGVAECRGDVVDDCLIDGRGQCHITTF